MVQYTTQYTTQRVAARPRARSFFAARLGALRVMSSSQKPSRREITCPHGCGAKGQATFERWARENTEYRREGVECIGGEWKLTYCNR